MPKTKRVSIDDLEVAKAVIANEEVVCFCGTEQKKGPQPKTKMVSGTGGVFWGNPVDEWPTTPEGEPLIPWLQIVTSEIKGLFGPLKPLQAVCFYIDRHFDDYEATSAWDDSRFVVREYARKERLQPLERPRTLKGHPFRRVTWNKTKDYPFVSKYFELFAPEVYDAICEMKNFRYAHLSGIKIGGWPTYVQRQEYPGGCDLQIDITENSMYGDSGVGYLSRAGDRWYVRFECC